MATVEQFATYYIKQFMFVIWFGSHNSPMGYSYILQIKKTQAQEGYISCSNAVNTWLRELYTYSFWVPTVYSEETLRNCHFRIFIWLAIIF